MNAFDLARFGVEPKCFWCNTEKARRLVQVEPRLDPIWRQPKDRDLMMRPERGDALACPSIAVAGHETIPIEDAGNQIIIGDQHQFPDSRDDIGGGAVALSSPALRQAQFGMDAAHPMDQENDL